MVIVYLLLNIYSKTNHLIDAQKEETQNVFDQSILEEKMDELINENRNVSQQLTNIEEEIKMSRVENSQISQRLETIENEVHLLKGNIDDLSLKGRKIIIYTNCRIVL